MSSNDDSMTDGTDANGASTNGAAQADSNGATTNPYAGISPQTSSPDAGGADADPFARLRRDSGEAPAEATPVENPYASFSSTASSSAAGAQAPAYIAGSPDGATTDAPAPADETTSAPESVTNDAPTGSAATSEAASDAATVDANFSGSAFSVSSSGETAAGDAAATDSDASPEAAAPAQENPGEATLSSQTSQQPYDTEASAAQPLYGGVTPSAQTASDEPSSAPSYGADAPAAQPYGTAAPAAQPYGSEAPAGQPYGTEAPAAQPYSSAQPYGAAAGAAAAGVPADAYASHYTPAVTPVQNATSMPEGSLYAPNPGAELARIEPAGAGDVPQEVYIGDISVTRDYLRSPQGVIPSAGAQIQVYNRTQMTNGIPTWAIIVAVVGFFIISFFSLFFLLAKEQRFSGGYEVIVSGPGGTLSSFVPVTQQSAGFVWSDLQSRADLARQVIAAA